MSEAFKKWFEGCPYAGAGKYAGEVAEEAWRAALNSLKVIDRYSRTDGQREKWSGLIGLNPGEAIAILPASSDKKGA